MSVLNMSTPSKSPTLGGYIVESVPRTLEQVSLFVEDADPQKFVSVLLFHSWIVPKSEESEIPLFTVYTPSFLAAFFKKKWGKTHRYLIWW